MMAELTIGRNTRKNPVGAFKALKPGSKLYPLIGMWGLICGVMILSFYTVVAGWTVSYVFEEFFYFLGMPGWADSFGNIGSGVNNAIFSVLFMAATISIIMGGVSEGIEKATKTMMPLLILILLILIGYTLAQPGSEVGLAVYLKPDLSKIDAQLIFAAMGQAFFSLSLGMGALITYGSYLNKKENIAEAAAYVTLFDVMIAFLAGLLVIPATYMAQAQGVKIFAGDGSLIAGPALIFQVLPNLFHSLGGVFGLVFGIAFFLLLSIAALTSTISLLEVPVSYAIDEHGMPRKKAALYIGIGILLISIVVSFDTLFINYIDLIFSQIGLPLGGLLICLFLGYIWKPTNALEEMEHGFARVRKSLVGRVWPIFMWVIAPAVILYNLLVTLFNNL